MSTAYHPQSDGQTERVNQCLENYLRCMVHSQRQKWHKWLSLSEWWYNINFHSSIKTTPFQALYGYPPPQLPMESPPKSSVEAVNQVLKERHQVMMELRQQLLKSQERMKRFADTKRTERAFEVGSWVYLKIQPYRQLTVQGVQNKKLGMKYDGPFEVLEKIGSVAYKLSLPPGSQIHPVFHVSQLKARIGEGQLTSPVLPLINPDRKIKELPERILARKLVKRGNVAGTQVLIKWSNGAEEDATWEDYELLARKYPQFVLEDKEAFMRGGVSGVERSDTVAIRGEEEVKGKGSDRVLDGQKN